MSSRTSMPMGLKKLLLFTSLPVLAVAILGSFPPSLMAQSASTGARTRDLQLGRMDVDEFQMRISE